MSGPERITLAMTGASGAQYGLRLLDCLIQEDREVHFLISKAAQLVMATETDVVLPAKPQAMQAFLSEYTGAAAGQIRVFAKEDWMAPPWLPIVASVDAVSLSSERLLRDPELLGKVDFIDGLLKNTRIIDRMVEYQGLSSRLRYLHII